VIRKNIFILILVISIFFPKTIFAQEFSSGSFKVLDPVIAPGGYSTSAGFQLWSNIAEIALGTSSSALYNLGAGFLRYPFASTPTVSATAGDGSVTLSWTSSTGFSGWTATSYSTGYSTTSGGPYIYNSLGNVLTSTISGLTNSTTYYFVVRVKDIFGNFIATSTQVSATPVSSSGGGGGGACSSGEG
jgi:hypothetical protein